MPDLKTSLSLDISKFVSSMSKATEKVGALGSAMRKKIGDGTGSIDKAQMSVDNVANSIDRLNRTKWSVLGIDQMGQSITKVGTKLTALGAKARASSTDAALAAAVSSGIGGTSASLMTAKYTALSVALGATATMTTRLGAGFSLVGTMASAGLARARAGLTAAGAAAQKLHTNVKKIPVVLLQASSALDKFATTMQGKMNTGNTSVKQAGSSLKQLGLNIKSLKNIAAGIMLAQAFYKIVNAIKEATAALYSFNATLERSKLVFTNFMGTASLATEFINVLEDFSATTPFSFEQAEASAKQLLAYGIQYQNLMYVMKGVMAAGAVSGDSEKVESISRAIGQIYTKGTLRAQEMLQLTDAGIDAWGILRDKIGLTTDQAQNLAAAQIPAAKAINALVDGMTEKYGNLLNYTNMTTSGLAENIKDMALQIGTSLFGKVFNKVRTTFAGIAAEMQTMKTIINTMGVGGLFEHLVPESLRGDLKNIVAAIQAIYVSIRAFASGIKSIFEAIGPGLLRVLSVLMSVAANVAIAFAMISSILTRNKNVLAAVGKVLEYLIFCWLAFKAAAIGSLVVTTVCSIIAKALAGLAAAMTVIVSHPIVAFFIGFVTIVAALTGKLGALRNAIQNAFTSYKSMLGINTSKMLLPETTKRAADLGKFNDKINDTSKGMDKLADSTGSAAKAARSLLSFDEVFKLNEDTGTDASTDIADQMEDIGNISFPNLDLSNVLPEFDTAPWLATISEKLNTLAGRLKEKFLGLFDEEGFDFGPLLVGAITAGILKLIGVNLLTAVAIAALTGIAITLGRKIGDKISEKLKIDVEIRGESLKFYNVADLGIVAGTVAAAAMKGFSGPIGLAIAAALVTAEISYPVGQKIGDALNELGESPENVMTEAGAALIGAGIGTFIAGPIGTAIGTAVGGGIGFAFTRLKEHITKEFKDMQDNGATNFGDWSMVTNQETMAWSDTSKATFSSWGKTVKEQLTKDFTDMKDSNATNFGDWSLTTNQDTMAWSELSNATFASWGETVKTKFEEVKTSTGLTIATWQQNCTTAVDNFKTSASNKILEFRVNAAARFAEFKTNAATTVDGWKTYWEEKTTAWSTAIDTAIAYWKEQMALHFKEFKEDAIEKLEAITSFSFTEWLTDTLKAWGDWFDSLMDKFSKLIAKAKEFFNLDGPETTTTTTTTTSKRGHATGGIFNREHYAKFAEGNKAEAIIPLENSGAMQPFVDAVSQGIVTVLAPILANNNGGGGAQQLRPLYVGTLVADDRGLKELNQRMQIIEEREDQRRGL